MTGKPSYSVVLFNSVNQTMWADKVLRGKSIPFKLIPVPRTISSDCGVCIRIDSGIIDSVRAEIESIDGFVDIVQL
jgi:hypothetical protein